MLFGLLRRRMLHQSPECFIYEDMLTVADTYFTSAQLLECVLLVLESRIERLLTSLKLHSTYLSISPYCLSLARFVFRLQHPVNFLPLFPNLPVYTCAYMEASV